MGLEGYEYYLKNKIKSDGTNLASSSIEKYTYYIKDYIDKLEEHVENEKFDDLIEFINSILDNRGTSALRSAFRNYLEYIGKDELIDDVDKVTAKNYTTNKKNLQSKVLSEAEVTRLYNGAKTPLMESFILFAYDTACRLSEILNVKVSDIEFYKDENGELVSKELQGMGSQNYESNIYASVQVLGKGSKKREVYLRKKSAKTVLNRIEIKDLDDDDHVFKLVKNDGDPYKNQTHQFWKRVKNLGEDVLGRHVTPHCLRHTRATHIVEMGGKALDVKNYLGHEQLQSSMIYIEYSSRQGRESFVKFTSDRV